MSGASYEANLFGVDNPTARISLGFVDATDGTTYSETARFMQTGLLSMNTGSTGQRLLFWDDGNQHHGLGVDMTGGTFETNIFGVSEGALGHLSFGFVDETDGTTYTEYMRLTEAGQLNINSTESILLPAGTTAQQPGTPIEGMFRYNSDDNAIEFWNGTAWVSYDGTGGTASAAGSDRQIQFNDGGSALGAAANFVYTSAGDFIVGSYQLDDTGTGNEDYRMFFDVSKGAFRAGHVTGTEWNDANVGIGSFAVGHETTATQPFSFASGSFSTASHYYTTAMGYYTTASGQFSIAQGHDVTASGEHSMAIGLGDATGTAPEVSGQGSLGIFMGNRSGINVADAYTMAIMGGDFVIGSYQLDDTTTGSENSRLFFDVSKSAFRAGYVDAAQWDDASVGNYSFASGNGTTASGGVSTALGLDTTASGGMSIAMGELSTASGSNSTAIGYSTTASGGVSTAIGSGSIASGHRSLATGWQTRASGIGSTAMGYQVIAGSGTAADGAGDGAFAIGLMDDTVTITTRPTVTGIQSMGIFMGDQDGGVDVASSNTLALLGGVMVIDPSVPATETAASTGGEQDLELDVTGDIGAVNYCDEDGNNCFTAASVASGSGVWQVTGGAGSEAVVTIDASAPYATSDFVFGSGTLDDNTGTTDDNSRMFFDKDRAAFRAGTSNDSNYMDEANIGMYSFGAGYMPRATGQYSVAMGNATTASGTTSVAIGNGVSATGSYSAAFGCGTSVTGGHAFVEGQGTLASAEWAVAMGAYTRAEGLAAFALGRDATASGDYSMAIGLGNATGTAPAVSGNNSIGIFMGDQSGVDVSSANTMAIMGGQVGIGTALPATILDIEHAGGTGVSNPAILRLTNSTSQGSAWIEFYEETPTADYQSFQAGYYSSADGSTNEFRIAGGWTSGSPADIENNPYFRITRNTGTAAFENSVVVQDSGDADLIIGSTDNGDMATLSLFESYDQDMSAVTGTASGARVRYDGDENEFRIETVVSGTSTNILRIDRDSGYSLFEEDAIIQSADNADLFVASTTDGNNATIHMYEQYTGDIDETLTVTHGARIVYDGSTNLFQILTGNSGSFTDRFNIARDTGDITMSGTGALKIHAGTTAQQPGTPIEGMFRYNTDDSAIEFWNGATWVSLDGTGGVASAAGNNREIQFNDGGSALGADTNFVYTSAGDFIVGSYQLDDTATGSQDYRMFFDVSKGAFRAGEAQGAQWDDANVGLRSTAFGQNSTASGPYSIAAGEQATASGYAATAFGRASTASNDHSIAMGYSSQASGQDSIAMGRETIASGDYSMALGLGNSTSTRPTVSGTSSLGIFMGDQDGVELSQANTMSLMGGSFGIGTVAPISELHVVDNNADSEAVVTIGPGNTDGLELRYYGTNSYLRNGYNDSSSNGKMYFITGGNSWENPIFTLGAKAGAGVGIWDSTPDARFEITHDGATTTEDYIMVSSDDTDPNNGDIMILDTNGNLGLGTATPQASLDINSTDSILLPRGTTAQQPGSPVEGMFRYNSDDNAIEFWNGTAWISLDGTGGVASAAGNNREIQFNDGGSALGADTNFVYTSAGDFIVGSYQLDDTGTGSEDLRMFFDRSKGAFRAGQVNSTQWDNANVGDYSVAMGSHTTASGMYSVALGNMAQATAGSAIAMGPNATASNYAAIALGGIVTASGDYSVAMGRDATASANYSMAIGLGDATGAAPIVSGANSLGIFMGDQSGVDVSSANVMAIMGGNLAIGNVNGTQALDVTGNGLFSGNLGVAEATVNNNYGINVTKSSSDTDTRGINSTLNLTGTDTGAREISGIRSNISYGANNNGEYTTVTGTHNTFGNTTSSSYSSAHMIYNYAETNNTGSTGSLYGMRTNMTHYGTGTNSAFYGNNVRLGNSSTGTISEAYGNTAVITNGSSGGNIDNAFASNNTIHNDGAGHMYVAAGSRNLIQNDEGDISTGAYGVTGEIEQLVAGGTIDDAVANTASITLTAGTINTAYLYRGVYTGSPTVAWGLHISGESYNTLSGKLMIGTTTDNAGVSLDLGSNTDSILLPVGTDAQQPGSPIEGMFRYNSDDNAIEFWNGTAWVSLDGTGGVASAAGNNREIQFNDGGSALGADTNFVYTSAGDFIVGSYQTDDTGNTAEDMRMFFSKSHGAFRAGHVTGTHWDDVNIGDFSVAMGYDSEATAETSVSIGRDTTASGVSSVAMGNNTTASGTASIALGNDTTANDYQAVALGSNNTASGSQSTAIGRYLTASGDRSLALGGQTLASGTASTAMGQEATASGDWSFAISLGDQTGNPTVSGQSSFGLFMGDQSGIDVSSSNTMAILGGDFIVGSPQTDDDGTHDYRMFFDVSSGAFRAGYVAGTQWDNTGVASGSVAFGRDTTASNINAFASGRDTVASGATSTAMGSNTTASGQYSTAIGSSALAQNTSTTAIGYNVNVTGAYSMGLSGGQHTSTAPIVSGANSVGIFAGDQGDEDIATSNAVVMLADYVGVGTAAPDVMLDVTGDIEYTGTLTDVSDRRLKENIEPLTKQGSLLNKIDQVKGYSFTMKDDEKHRTEYGVIAQELEEIFPDLVHTAHDEIGTKSVNYVGLIAPMIEATKELKAENDSLKQELASVNKSLEDISKQVALLNTAAGNNVGKASMLSYLWILLALMGGVGLSLIVQRKYIDKVRG